MAGTLAGGRQAGKTNIARYGKDYYKILGSKGGKAWNRETSPPRGFMIGDRARIYGAIGGSISRRKKAKK